MRSRCLTLLALAASLPLHAQTFNAPESVEYDPARHRWLVSQNGGNRIDVYRPGSAAPLTTLTTGITNGPHGLEVVGDTVYACDGSRIRGFDLNTGQQVFSASLTGASFLNGLASDGARYLFATDFSTQRIYRVNILTGATSRMANTPRTPNGIIYDGAHNRCVFVTWGANAAIMALSLADSTITTLQTTSLGNIDGITRDPAGNWYVSAWSNNALHRLAPGFSTAPTSVMSGLSNPADIGISAAGDSIGIPNAGSASNVVFFTGTALSASQAAADPLLPLQCFPNPATTHCLVRLPTRLPGATLALYDAAGQRLRHLPLSDSLTRIERGHLPPGFYYVVLYDEQARQRAVQKVAFTH
ncbi:MAG TPA: hypothetical protein VEI97_19285 [bacterium]|nr:hypothetical protein [bacterium]